VPETKAELWIFVGTVFAFKGGWKGRPAIRAGRQRPPAHPRPGNGQAGAQQQRRFRPAVKVV